MSHRFASPLLPSELSDAQRAYVEKRWRQKIVAVAALSARLAKLEPSGPEIRRVSGDQPCSVCDLPYRDHPDHPFAPTFHVVCDGSVVKT